MMNNARKLSRIGAWLAVLTIIVLSVVPGDVRPHILGNDYAEHFTAYFIAGGLFAIGYQRSILSSGTLLAMSAGLLELAQLWIPGRIAGAVDVAAGAIGAWLDLLIIAIVKRAHERMFVVSYD
ncbi:VanZ family protein [Bradyrhizobium sp. STM 3557]|uniref:VanZ family protein n=1 Tax=Bradyrhizobium sp. STM 3557 TaxID=578920 RepID=UPI0038901831